MVNVSGMELHVLYGVPVIKPRLLQNAKELPKHVLGIILLAYQVYVPIFNLQIIVHLLNQLSIKIFTVYAFGLLQIINVIQETVVN